MVVRPLAFEVWYQAEHARVLASMLLICGDLDEAAEATDEAFARAYERWERVSGMAAPGGWTQRVALNVVRRRARRRSLERRFLARQLPEGYVPAPAGEGWLLLERLSRRQREAVVLRYMADLPEIDVAQIMGVRRGTVSATLAAARRALSSHLEESIPEGSEHG